MPKIDYKKDDKQLYLPKATPALIDVPAITFLMVDGQGDPNGEAYQRAVSLLYILSYTIKMKGKQLPGYCDYTVFPLEGLWWIDGCVFDFAQRDNWRWTSMIRQPDFVTPAVLAWAIELARKKHPDADYANVRLETFTEGLCVQMMHKGPYATEPETVEAMRAYMAQNGLVDAITFTDRKHHEIYLSDPNKVAPEKRNTVLRHPVERL